MGLDCEHRAARCLAAFQRPMRGGNILHADQHRDMESGVFFQRAAPVQAARKGLGALRAFS